MSEGETPKERRLQNVGEGGLTFSPLLCLKSIAWHRARSPAPDPPTVVVYQRGSGLLTVCVASTILCGGGLSRLLKQECTKQARAQWCACLYRWILPSSTQCIHTRRGGGLWQLKRARVLGSPVLAE